MLVEQIWTGNDARNFHYLIACEETGEALAIDPWDYERVLNIAKDKGWEITQVLNTHHHHDHTGGNAGMIQATGAKLLAHEEAGDLIDNVDIGLGAGDSVKIGKTVELEAMDTPGHTMSHICLFAHETGDNPALFCGDTLFNAGAGHCKSGGHPESLYATFVSKLATLPEATKVYPGHDYIENNLNFTLNREPDNAAAQKMLATVKGQDTNQAYITTLAEEKQFNTFFRLHSDSVIERLREAFPDLPKDPDEKTVFLKLRELRNSW